MYYGIESGIRVHVMDPSKKTFWIWCCLNFRFSPFRSHGSFSLLSFFWCLGVMQQIYKCLIQIVTALEIKKLPAIDSQSLFKNDNNSARDDLPGSSSQRGGKRKKREKKNSIKMRWFYVWMKVHLLDMSFQFNIYIRIGNKISAFGIYSNESQGNANWLSIDHYHQFDNHFISNVLPINTNDNFQPSGKHSTIQHSIFKYC